MEPIKSQQPADISYNFDEALKDILIEDLNVFKLTKGRFLCNNQRKFQNNHLVA